MACVRKSGKFDLQHYKKPGVKRPCALCEEMKRGEKVKHSGNSTREREIVALGQVELRVCIQLDSAPVLFWFCGKCPWCFDRDGMKTIDFFG